MKGLLLVCAAMAAIHGTARADADAAAIKKIVDAQMKAITNQDGKAFAATFDEDAFANLPGGYGITGGGVARAMKCAWTNPEGSYDPKLTKLVTGRQGDVAWATIDLVMTEALMDMRPIKTPMRWTELFTREGKTWMAHALYSSEPEKDDPEQWAGYDFTTDAPPGAPTDGAPLVGWLASTGDLAAHLHAGAEVVALGSAAGERGDGPGAAKLLASWKKLAFTTAWTRSGGDGKTWAWTAARVSRKAKGKHGLVDEPYWALVLAVHGAQDWEIVNVHYGQTHPLLGDGPGCTPDE
jgi:ketosteroid isomerase-like protein